MGTVKLINRNNEVASIALQSVIRQAIVNIGGIDEVIIGEVFEDEITGNNMMPVYYESEDNGDVIEEFLFNVDLSDYSVV